MGQFFFSYSRKDSEIVDQFVHAIEKEGMDAWVDREDIRVGNSWRKEIVEAIDACDAFVFFMSSNSVASLNVQKEITLAQDSNRPLYVIMLEVVRLPAEIRYQLAGLQFINFELLGFENAAKQLVDVLKPHQKKNKQVGEKQTELVIQGVDLSAFDADKQKELLAFISNLADTDASQLKIANMAAGSVHVFVNMPASAAYQLKTMALNRDNRFGTLGIASLRLTGDSSFIYISLGILTTAATLGFFSWLWMKIYTIFTSIFGVAIGKVMIAATTVVLVAGIGYGVTTISQPNSPIVNPQADSAPVENGSENATATPSLTPSPTATQTLTPTLTFTPTLTLTPTETKEAVSEFKGKVLEHTTCFHGPDSYFLFRYGVIEGIGLQVFGKDINNGWAYVHPEGYEGNCWMRLSQITFDGSADDLKVLYPGEVGPLLSFLWPVPQNIKTARTIAGDKVSITWDEFILPDGEIEDPDSPRYMLELWLCEDSNLSFSFHWVWAPPELLVTDEPGCSEPSHGNIYLVEKHGYSGPVEIPWPPYPAP